MLSLGKTHFYFLRLLYIMAFASERPTGLPANH